MERLPGNIIKQDTEKNIQIKGNLCETPRINGSKPFEIPRTQEQCKKHIRRDGRK